MIPYQLSYGKTMTDKFEVFTDEQLDAEIKRRKKKEEKASRPVPLENPDFSGLIEVLEDTISTMADPEKFSEDDEHWAYEAAMEAVYGKSVWPWVNSRT